MKTIRLIRVSLALTVLMMIVPMACAGDSDNGGLLSGLAKPQSGRSMRATSTFRRGSDGKYDPNARPLSDDTERSNSDNFHVLPGASHVLLDAKGPGVITHMWITFLGPEKQDWAKNGSANHQDMLLRIYYDGSDRPAVEAPLGDFFANCFGRRDAVNSLPVIVDHGNSYNCFWNMPFRKSVKIEIINQSPDKAINLLYYNVDWIKKDKISDDTPYFYAQYRQEYPVNPDQDYLILDTKGKGHYVGTVLAVRTRSPSWFGEGDEKMYVDGEKVASIWGTGTEDYFLSAWGLKKTQSPYFGVPYFDQWGIVGGHTSAFRWHLNDPIVFNTGLKVTIEHRGWMSPDENKDHKSMSWNNREDDFSSVAYWYQTGTPTFTARAPSGPERKLPSLERAVSYGRDFTDDTYHGEGKATTQDVDFYDGPQLFYQPKDKKDAWVEIPIEVKKKEPLRLLVSMTTSQDYGKYQPYLDGVKLGNPIDLYSNEESDHEFHLLDFWPEPGTYKLKLVCVGKAPQSGGYYLGMDSVRLRERRPRVTEMGFDKDKDWKQDPKVYD